MIIQELLNKIGISGSDISPAHGGDISDSYFVDTGSDEYFIKINSSSNYPDMFQLERDGLIALKTNSLFSVPEVKEAGEVDDVQYLILSRLNESSFTKSSWQKTGHYLADMHQRNLSKHFGWEHDNYIGSIKQKNTFQESWIDFFMDCRIEPLFRRLIEAGKVNTSVASELDKLRIRLPDILPEEKPSLLHGDLWRGNIMAVENEEVSIYDPAVYYGHREMDVAMTLLFGSFDHAFYSSYEEKYPLQRNWKERVQLFQLYPLLVHAVLFGGSYINQSVSVLKSYS